MTLETIEFKTQINPDILSQSITIQTNDEYSHWGDVMKLCKNKIKDTEDERKEYTKPIDEAKKRLMDKEKQITEPIKEYIKKIETEMAKWFVAEEKRRQAEQKRLEDEAIANAKPEDCDVIVPIVESVKTTRGDVATSTAIKYNDFELIALNEVPNEYLMLDENKVKEAINKGGVKSIAGIRILEKVRFLSR